MTGIPSIDTLNVQYRVTEMFGTFYPLSTDPEILLYQEEVGLDRTFKAVMDPAFDPEDAAVVARRKLILWDGRTGDGVALPSGAYFAYVRAGALTGRTKVILLR